MTFTKRKSASKDAADKPKKLRVVSVRLTEEEYQQVVENCRKSRQKIVGFLATGTAQRQDNGTDHARRYGDTSSDWEHEQQPESTCYGSQRD